MKLVQFMALAGILVFSNATLSHHSDAGIDDNSVVALEGKVTEFSWRQPHVYISVETMENGEPVLWEVQLASVNGLTRQGWSAGSLVPGDEVFVRLNPATNGRRYGKISSIERADGTPVAVVPDAPEISIARTDSLAGKWTSRRPGTGSRPRPEAEAQAQAHAQAEAASASDGAPPCNTGFDCFFRTNLVLSEAGKAAAESFDPLSADNPEATCVGRPTPSALVSAGGYLLEFDLNDAEEKIVIRSEWFNEERTIWMDGRSHPDASETLATGHSIGHWEGGTLVVDTRNFDDHRSPYQIGVPSGSQKHVVERYRLNDDGISMQAEFMLEDPEFLAESFTNRKNLYFSPHMEMLAMDCDLENTSRFLRIDK